ncbi:MAG: HPr(Ser) kinase/phosphatase [Deltaproteobacteria bacterium]|nr:HPr(Ser) kinase/phosphatase [Deltaproteobacteria bacterium]MCW5801898.1 HPr(Ser) kinase/phosphatase [Deltaproteobacteria bacterium]
MPTPITVSELLERADLGVTAIAGTEGLSRTVTAPRIQKPGLALTGWPEQLHDGRVLVLGATEIDYLADSATARTLGLATLFASEPACVVVCRGLAPPPELRAAAETRGVPLLSSSLLTADFIAAVTVWMTDRLAPSQQIHGVLLDVLGIGCLLLGKSGIGKSETALDLVVRGHRLVADDIILLRRHRDHVIGRGAGLLGHHMEIRGLGIINIKDLFGIAAVRETKKVELVVELHEWSAHEEYDRLGFDDRTDDLLGVAVPAVRVPVRPGRNLATLVEVAARNQLLKYQGIHSARAFRDQLDRAMLAARDGAMDAVE